MVVYHIGSQVGTIMYTVYIYNKYKFKINIPNTINKAYIDFDNLMPLIIARYQ